MLTPRRGGWHEVCSEQPGSMNYETIDRDGLRRIIDEERLDNGDPEEGVALVNVLGADMFEQKHIPLSINIPADELDGFERRFSKDKRIIVYCASKDCDASPRAAKALAKRGFSRVFDYVGGMDDWERANQPVAGRQAVPGAAPS